MKQPDLTPSLIADRLCPEAAGPIIRQIIEAAVEKAIALTPSGKTSLAQSILVERNVCLAARIVLQRQSERLENLMLALKDDEDQTADCTGLHDDGIADGNLTRCSKRTGCGLAGCPYRTP